MDIDKYLKICEQLGQEPDPEKMPLDPSDFPEEVQVAFFISSLLSDRWDGGTGTYLGKDYSNIQYLFELYKIDNPTTILFFIRMYDNEVGFSRMDEKDRQQKAHERKQNTGGNKNFTHNVKG
jgi:hypothetical protein